MSVAAAADVALYEEEEEEEEYVGAEASSVPNPLSRLSLQSISSFVPFSCKGAWLRMTDAETDRNQ